MSGGHSQTELQLKDVKAYNSNRYQQHKHKPSSITEKLRETYFSVSGDEVAYELEIRDIPVERTTMNENRASLTGALRFERDGVTPGIHITSTLEPYLEFGVCEGKLIDLDNMRDFDNSNRLNEFERISSGLFYINSRLQRISIFDEDQEETRRGLICHYLQLMVAVGNSKDNSIDRDRSASLGSGECYRKSDNG
ncbi:hypothetical protein JTB14_037425 [Gonioctena quinquepunctata]|nr:hypothetical protein JTB14_037425 [Gonioctena quinquepunctata]